MGHFREVGYFCEVGNILTAGSVLAKDTVLQWDTSAKWETSWRWDISARWDMECYIPWRLLRLLFYLYIWPDRNSRRWGYPPELADLSRCRAGTWAISTGVCYDHYGWISWISGWSWWRWRSSRCWDRGPGRPCSNSVQNQPGIGELS